MFLVIEGVAGSGKSTLRDRLLRAAAQHGFPVSHLGQHSWLSLSATRSIVALRSGRRPGTRDSALNAVRADLALHTAHNVAHVDGHLIADRWAISSAATLAMLYGGSAASYLAVLTRDEPSQPDLLVLLNTPISLCRRRLAGRSTAHRFLEADGNLEHLNVLQSEAAHAWGEFTGRTVITRPAATPADAETLVAEVFQRWGVR